MGTGSVTGGGRGEEGSGHIQGAHVSTSGGLGASVSGAQPRGMIRYVLRQADVSGRNQKFQGTQCSADMLILYGRVFKWCNVLMF